MTEFFLNLHPVTAALLAGLFTWALTAVGAAVVFATRCIGGRLLASALGFSAGVMMAASFWSLLTPSIRMAQEMGLPIWLPAVTGFLLGCLSFGLIDRFLPHLHLGCPPDQAEGVRTPWKRTTLLVLAITLHNIPEGLAIGVAVGAAAAQGSAIAMASALALALGIGIQNIPEGMAISIPLRASGFSRIRSFMVGQMSGLMEPLAALIAAAAVFLVRPILPYALAFAAGAMVFVVVEELIPESQAGKHGDAATMGFVIGFTAMMFLEIGLS